MVVWLSPDTGSMVSAAKLFLRLSDDEDDDSGGSAGGAEDKCCVYLAGMREDQVLRALPRCGHCFHDKCIGKWLKAHPTCPVCRTTAVARSQAAAAVRFRHALPRAGRGGEGEKWGGSHSFSMTGKMSDGANEAADEKAIVWNDMGFLR
ncbi:hypothetical protein BDA96_09G103100 [Sorghum bicolor]|uniref:RING-type E3 ubiquitin transferase n=1 Tax=Sorghum bicolor TaxID=4558 RepID=A0A921QC63_SORBI|nr:hypothetical protein BDA96_09G103100 [Sorghum bicolor]